MEDKNLNNNELEKIIAEVKSDVIGQDVAVEQVCSLIDMGKERCSLLEKWEVDSNCKPPFCSALLIGTSGSGKTHMLKNIAEHENMIFWDIDATTLTGEGWKGASLSTHWGRLSKQMEDEPDKMVLVFIDEVDKIMKDDGHPGSAKFDLLKPLEGGICRGEFDNKLFEMNFDRCVVIMSGAFTDIDNFRAEKEIAIGFKGALKAKGSSRKEVSREDLIKWGAPRELVGRFSVILNLNELQRFDYKEIIDTQIVKKYSALLPNFDVKVSEEAVDFLSEEAIEKNLGARYISQCINDVFTKKVWRKVNSRAQSSGVIKLVMKDDSLECEFENCQPNFHKTFTKQKEGTETRNSWAREIKAHVDAASLNGGVLEERENLVKDVFEYMAILKYEDKNVCTANNKREVYNDYSFAELDLLFCIICTLKYYCREIDYNYEGLKTMFNLCQVNYLGISRLEAFFMDVNIDRSDQSVDKIALKNKPTGKQVGCGKFAAGEYFSATQPIARRTYIREDELMIKAYNEFMSYPLSERDEAVKMLAWRLI